MLKFRTISQNVTKIPQIFINSSRSISFRELFKNIVPRRVKDPEYFQESEIRNPHFQKQTAEQIEKPPNIAENILNMEQINTTNFIKHQNSTPNSPSTNLQPTSHNISTRLSATAVEEFKFSAVYEPPIDPGLDRFQDTLLNQLEEYKALSLPEQLTELNRAIHQYSQKKIIPMREEYIYQLRPHEDELYRDVIYDSSLHNMHKYKPYTDQLRGVLQQPLPKIRSLHEYAQICAVLAELPSHPQIKSEISTQFEIVPDPYHYLHPPETKEYPNTETLPLPKEIQNYIKSENEYTDLALNSYDRVTKSILEELTSLEFIQEIYPIPINKYFYYRNNNNPADILSIWRNKMKRPERGSLKYERNSLKEMNNEIDEVVFGLSDVFGFYQRYSDVSNINEFVLLLRDIVEHGERDPIYYFQPSLDNRYVAIFVDIHHNSFSYELLVKDMEKQTLYPVVIPNTSGDIAFDNLGGIYYTQLDLFKRPHRVFRMDIATNRHTLIYEELSPQYEISLENTKSGEYILINIKSKFTPTTNEIWIRSVNSLDDFILFQRMKYEIEYNLKHSGDFFYQCTNHLDPLHKKKSIIKVRIPEPILFLATNRLHLLGNPQIQSKMELEEAWKKFDEKEEKMKSIQVSGNSSILDSSENIHLENIPIHQSKEKETLNKVAKAKNFADAKYSLIVYNENLLEEIVPKVLDQMIKTSEEITTENDEMQILDFEVYSNYLTVLESVGLEKNIKCHNMLKNTLGHRVEIGGVNHLSFEVGNLFDSHILEYNVRSPNELEQKYQYNMATGLLSHTYTHSYSNLNTKNYKYEEIQIEARDGNIIPCIIVYHKEYYSTKSPYLIYVNDSKSGCLDFCLKESTSSLLERGVVCCFPCVRGTGFLDEDWKLAGTKEHKLRQFMDIIDVGIYFKQIELTKKVSLLADGVPSCVTAISAIFKEPNLFDVASLHNGAYDLLTLCESTNEYIKEFGDIRQRNYYDHIKYFSPYHVLVKELPHTDILFTMSEGHHLAFHSRKLLARMRPYTNKTMYMFHKEFDSQVFSLL